VLGDQKKFAKLHIEDQDADEQEQAGEVCPRPGAPGGRLGRMPGKCSYASGMADIQNSIGIQFARNDKDEYSVMSVWKKLTCGRSWDHDRRPNPCIADAPTALWAHERTPRGN